MESEKERVNQKRDFHIGNNLMVTGEGVDGGLGEIGDANIFVVMNTRCCWNRSVESLYTVHLKLILHCLLTNWNLNKNIKIKSTWLARFDPWTIVTNFYFKQLSTTRIDSLTIQTLLVVSLLLFVAVSSVKK